MVALEHKETPHDLTTKTEIRREPTRPRANAEACSSNADGAIDRSQHARHPGQSSGGFMPRYCLELALRNPSWQRSCATASKGRTYDRNRFDPHHAISCRQGAVAGARNSNGSFTSRCSWIRRLRPAGNRLPVLSIRLSATRTLGVAVAANNTVAAMRATKHFIGCISCEVQSAERGKGSGAQLLLSPAWADRPRSTRGQSLKNVMLISLAAAQRDLGSLLPLRLPLLRKGSPRPHGLENYFDRCKRANPGADSLFPSRLHASRGALRRQINLRRESVLTPRAGASANS
jgi:hypothetical protein